MGSGLAARRAPERPQSLDDRLVEVTPFRVLLFDQPDLPIAPPLFDFLLTADRGRRIIIDLEPYQAINVVSPREPRDNFGLVLIDPADEIVGHAQVKGSVPPACEKIDVKAGHAGTAL